MKQGKKQVSLLIIAMLIFPGVVPSQVDPGVMPASIFEIRNVAGYRLGTVLVVGESGRGYEEDNEYWTFGEASLLGIAGQERLELSVLAAGDWDDPWVVDALRWRPDDPVQWSHPATVEWNDDEPPIVPEGIYFGNATVGGLMIQVSPRGASSLTWFKLTEGPYMLLGDGAVFAQDEDVPETGSWWQGEI